MPLIINKETKRYALYIWEITESFAELNKSVKLNVKEIQAIDSFKNQQRKLQFLATRAILQEKYPENVAIHYDHGGKPNLNIHKKISISHSYQYAGMLISEADSGLDLELIKDKIVKISSKFLSTEEQKFIHNNDLKTLYLCWGAKESVVKMMNNKKLIYNRDIVIKPFLPENEGNFEADLYIGSQREKIQFSYMIQNDLSIVWTIHQ